MKSSQRVDGWDFLTLLLWSLFFAAGLVPEPVFLALRTIAQVPTPSALVNSSAIITVTFAAYFAFFVRRRCLNSGLTSPEANGRAIQIGMVALIAFLEIPQRGLFSDGRTLLYIVLRSHEIPDLYLKSVVLVVGAAKLLAWWYLYSLVLRYHAFGSRDVFTGIVSVFPSARPEKPAAKCEEPEESDQEAAQDRADQAHTS